MGSAATPTSKTFRIETVRTDFLEDIEGIGILLANF